MIKPMITRMLLPLILMKGGLAEADSRTPVDLEKLTAEADVVALVGIVSGELVSDATGVVCGASYRARVERTLKGTTDGVLITLGRYGGYSIGAKYFAFLKHDNRRSPLPLQYSFGWSPSSLRPDCWAVVPSLEAMHGGFIVIEPGELVEYRPAINLPRGLYLIPDTIRAMRKPGGYTVDRYFYGSVQVAVEDFYNFIQSKLPAAK